MKKARVIGLLTLFTAILFSCKKNPEVRQQPNPPQSPVVTPPQQRALNYLSSWTTLSLSNETDRQSNWLQGSFLLPDITNYDYTIQKQFVFMRVPGRDSYAYYALPMQIQTSSGDIDISFDPGQKGFIVKIVYPNLPRRSAGLESTYIRNSSFRFLVLSQDVFNAHNIDWTDYDAVATALGPTIWFE